MKMTTIPPYGIVALVAILLPLSACDLIDDTCKQTPNDNLCTAILRPDPRSRGADVAGLALIVVDAVKARSTSTLEEINKLLKTNPSLKVPLTGCTEHYKFILQYDTPGANEALEKGDPKFAEESMNDSASVAQECEDGFKSFGSSPLTARNKEISNISAIAVAIIRLLL